MKIQINRPPGVGWSLLVSLEFPRWGWGRMVFFKWRDPGDTETPLWRAYLFRANWDGIE